MTTWPANMVQNLGTPAPDDEFWYNPIARPTASGIKVDNDVALTYSAVWACSRLLSSSAACLPLNLLATRGDQRVIAKDHQVHRIIHQLWNPEHTSSMFRSMAVAQQVNAGNFYAEIERDTFRRPVHVWPIHHTRVIPRRADNRLSANFNVDVGALIFEVKNPTGEPTFIRDEDMFHVPSMVSDNGRIGKGVIAHARDSIGMGLATERQGAAYHKRGRPAYAVIGGRFKTPEDRDSYRQYWEEVHSETGRPAMLPDGSSLTALGFSAEDQQFLQTRQHNVEEIARWYNVPPHMIQHLLRATFNNIEHMAIEFVVYSLIPWLKIWEEVIWHKLLTPNEQRRMFAKHNVDGLLRGDSKSRSEFYEKMSHMGVFTVNDVLRKEDMNPIGPDGDKRLVPLNFTTLEQAGEEPEGDEPEDVPIVPPADDGSEEQDADDTLTQLVEYEKLETPERPDLELREEQIRSSAKLMVSDAVQRMLSKERTAILRASKKQTAADFAIWCDEFYKKHRPTVVDALKLPVNSFLLAAGDEPSQLVVEWLAERHIEASKNGIATAIATNGEPLHESLQGLVADWPSRVEFEASILERGAEHEMAKS